MPLLALALRVPPLIEGQTSHCQGDAVVHEHHKQTREDGNDAQANCCQVGVGKAGAGIPVCHLHDGTVMVSCKAWVPCEVAVFVLDGLFACCLSCRFVSVSANLRECRRAPEQCRMEQYKTVGQKRIGNQIKLFSHWFIHSFIHSSMHAFIHPSLHPFKQACMHSFIHSRMHSTIFAGLFACMLAYRLPQHCRLKEQCAHLAHGGDRPHR